MPWEGITILARTTHGAFLTLRDSRSKLAGMDRGRGQRANDVVIALTQRPAGMRLNEIADAISAPLTSIQRAAASLVRGGLVTTSGERSPRYAINTRHPAAEALIEFCLRAVPVERAMDVVVRANPAVQFAGRDQDGYIIVVSPFAEPADVARLGATLAQVNQAREDPVRFEIAERGDVREILWDDLTLRDRGLGMTTVKGSAPRTFHDPHEHGSGDAARLDRLHPSLPRLPRRAVRRLAEENGLARIAFFGSAVRSDFRPGSDVDVMIEGLPGTPVRLGTILDIQERLERLLDRDVDVVNVRYLDDAILRRAREEAVVLYERAGSKSS